MFQTLIEQNSKNEQITVQEKPSGCPEILYCSFNRQWINKALPLSKKTEEEYSKQFAASGLPQSDYGKPLGTLDGVRFTKVSMAYKWQNVEASLEQVFLRLTTAGYSISPWLSNNHRTSENFVKSNIAMVDIDEGLTISDVKAHEFYIDYSAGYYTSPSHTEEDHRLRLLFLLERTITDEQEMRAILMALISVFGGDKSCKDASRLFYGSKDAEYEIRYGKFIPDDVIDILIEAGQVEDRNESGYVLDASYEEPTDRMRQYVLQELKHNTAFNNDRDSWLRACAGLKQGGYTLADFTSISLAASSTECKKLWDSLGGRAGGRRVSTMGTVWMLIGGMKLYYEKYPEERPDNKQLEPSLEKVIADKKKATDISGLALVEYEPLKEEDIQYDDRYTKEIPLVDGTFFVKSPKGTGKTYQLTGVVQKCRQQKKSVLLIGHRVSLLQTMAERLELTNYKTLGWNTATEGDTKYLAICVNSLERLVNSGKVKKYDVVLMDESEQVLQHFVGSTIKSLNRKKVSKLFYDLVHDAESVICLDADLGTVTLEAINTIRGEGNVSAHINTHKVEGQAINMWENKQNLIDDLDRSINNGRSVFLATNSKNFVDEFSDYLTSNKIKHTAITSDNSDTDITAEYLCWIGKAKNVRQNEVLLASPSLGTGVDIQAPFDVVYGLFEVNVTTHYDFDQQISRVRNAGEVNVWVGSQRYNECTDWATVKNNLIQNDKATRTLMDYTVADVSEPWFDMVLNLHSMVMASRARSMNSLRTNFEALKVEQGWKVKPVARIKKKTMAADTKAMRLVKREQLKKDLGKADQLSYDEYIEVHNRKRKSEAQKLSVQRYEIEDFFNDDVQKNPDMVDWYLGDEKKCLRAYEQFQYPPEVLQAMDRGSMDKHIIDRKNLSLKVETLKAGLEQLGLWKNGEYNGSQVMLKDNDNVNDFIKWAKQYAGAIEQTVKLKVDGVRADERPMEVVKSFLKVAGLKIVKVGRDRVGNKKNYVDVYQLDSCHLDWLQQQSENREK